MPKVNIFRRTANIGTDLQLAVGTVNAPQAITLFPGQYRKSAVVSAAEVAELITNCKTMEAAGQIGWDLDMGDMDPNSKAIVGGLDIRDGDTPNTASDYYVNVSGGKARLGSHTLRWLGANDRDPLSDGYDLTGASTAGQVLADNNTRKCRWIFVRRYASSVDLDSGSVIAIFGDEGTTAALGGLDDNDGFPTDAQMEAAIDGLNAAQAGSNIYSSWIELSRQVFSRSGATITTEFLDLKDLDADANEEEGFITQRYFIDHALFTAAATQSLSLSGAIEHAALFSASLRVLEASDLADLNVSLGTTGELDEIFDEFNVGTNGSELPGPKATARRGANPKLAGDVLVDYSPVLTFATGGPNLNTATSGTVLVTLVYKPFPETQPGVVAEGNFVENEL